jgi:hypothetical protein
LEWTEISNKFLESANSETNYVRVMWSKVFSGDVRARKGTILSKEQWKSTMENSFLPRYKDGKNWENLTARNFTLYEYSLDVPSDVRYKADNILRQASEIKLTSVYHTTLGKRLVVDGVHRSISLQLKINKGEHLPKVGLIECYGTNVVEMFKADFRHLII